MESILKEIRTYNVKHQISPSENKVIDRLLEYPVEMQSLYALLQTAYISYTRGVGRVPVMSED